MIIVKNIIGRGIYMLNSRIASSILSLAIILPLVLIGCNDKTISGKGETSQLKV